MTSTLTCSHWSSGGSRERKLGKLAGDRPSLDCTGLAAADLGDEGSVSIYPGCFASVWPLVTVVNLHEAAIFVFCPLR